MTKEELDHKYYVAQKSTAAYRSRNAAGSRRRREALKREVLTHYSQNGVLQCSWPCCPVDDLDMLSLDHVHNDGAADRKRMSGKRSGSGGQELYRRVRRDKYPEGFQALCHNHQMKKEILRKRAQHV